MRKVFLSLVAVLLCGVTFAQTVEISTKAQFLAIDGTKNYVQTANIDLGDLGEKTSAIIASLSSNKTYDGGGFTITYQAKFKSTADDQNFGLFGVINSGATIQNLNINANVTMTGNFASSKLGLLCGKVNGGTTYPQRSKAKVTNCNVIGNINSTAVSGGLGNCSTGLIVGSLHGDLCYSTGHGNVIGTGYVGGLVGSTGEIFSTSVLVATKASIKGCYFTGEVTAANSNSNVETARSYGGGICGYTMPSASITFCVAEAVVITGQNYGGITHAGVGGIISGIISDAASNISNTYCSGTVNGNIIDTDGEVVSVGTESTAISNTYFGDEIDDIVYALEQARCPNESDCDNNFYFAVINGKVVLVIGEKPTEEPETPTICEAPINLSVTVGENGAFTASWEMNTEDEFTFYYTLTNDEDENFVPQAGETENMELSGNLPASATPYVFNVKTKCSDQSYSEEVSYSFFVYENCPPVANLQVTNIQPTTAEVTWEGEISAISLGEVSYDIPESENILLEGLVPNTEYTLTVVKDCPEYSENETITTTITFKTHSIGFETAQSGNFNDPNTWNGGVVPDQNQTAYMTISTGHTVTVNHNLVLKNNYNFVANNGILQITQQGQLIDNTTGNNSSVPGIVEIVSEQKTINKWTFIGAPFTSNNGNYKFGSVAPVSGSDIAMVKWIHNNGEWNTDWAAVRDEISAGEGAFAWPFYNGVVTFSTHDFGYNTGYPNPFTNVSADYRLNKGTVEVEKTLPTGANRWMALVNPYPAKLKIESFLGDNTNIQGGVTYRFNGTSFEIQDATNGEILMTEGFFVNLSSGNKVTFTQDQLSYNYQPAPGSKSSANEFIELTLVNGKDKVRVYFAHNEDAEQGYDIFDANKMFSSDVAEPYFVTDGIALIKEEVAELPYYATMNVRSQEDTVMNFVLTNLPEGYAVSIIDGEEVIDMVEGGVYSTEILTGENADRFKVLVKKNVGIADVEELDVTITNNNRQVNITADKAVRTEVYNILGQKVFETNNTTFVLDNVASGAYVVKVYGASASKTQKIVIE